MRTQIEGTDMEIQELNILFSPEPDITATLPKVGPETSARNTTLTCIVTAMTREHNTAFKC